MRRDYHRNLADRERELTTLIQGRTRTLAGRAERKALEDVERAAQVDVQFADFGLGIVDASIVAMAERLDVRRILTIDGDFAAVRMGKRWNKGFELVVGLS